MKQITPFDFDGHEVRTLNDDQGQTWFVAADVAGVLEYRDASRLTRLLADDEKGAHIVGTLGGNQQMAVINEPGLYRAIFSSRSPKAEPFRRWVFHDVLPSLRNKGHYATEGSRLDTMMQRRTIGYRSLWSAYGTDRPPTGDLLQRLMTSFDKLAQEAGLPSQYEGVSPNPEMYLMTPALARHLIEAYCLGKQNGGRKAQRALKWLDERTP